MVEQSQRTFICQLSIFFLLAMMAFYLSGCGSSSQVTATQIHGQRGAVRPGGTYVIRRGDTLFGIAWRYGVDVDDLARWNGISNKNHILVGQKLRTTPPTGAVAQKVVAPTVTKQGQAGWIWPTKGKVVQTFSATEPGRQGLRIAGSQGQTINAARDGEVAYVGDGLSGFGRMVIIRHSNKVLTAYGFLDASNVKEGQKVSRGQKIGSMGIGPKNTALLHFETRQQGQPVDPYSYIGTTPRY